MCLTYLAKEALFYYSEKAKKLLKAHNSLLVHDSFFRKRVWPPYSSLLLSLIIMISLNGIDHPSGYK